MLCRVGRTRSLIRKYGKHFPMFLVLLLMLSFSMVSPAPLVARGGHTPASLAVTAVSSQNEDSVAEVSAPVDVRPTDLSAALGDGGNYLWIQGRATNVGRQRAFLVTVVINIYDAQGKSMVTAVDEVGRILEPGESYAFAEPFALVSFRRFPFNYDMTVEAREYQSCKAAPDGPMGEAAFRATLSPQEAFWLLGDALRLVITYDASAVFGPWLLYDPIAWRGNFLSAIEPGKGYWLLMLEDCTLERGNSKIPLKRGWNLIGWPP